jgi:DNA-binding LacI/PurR family transcriptional regulator
MAADTIQRVVITRTAADGSERRPVMHDVARLAGVSHQTVSRVLNNHPSVKATTRERVLDAMRELDYRPNNLARSLVTSRTHRIGVLGFDLRYYGPGSTLVAIEQAAHDRGYALALASMTDLDARKGADAVAMLDAQRVDGLIVIAPRRGAVEAIGNLPGAIPIVALESEFRKDVSVVSIDQRAGARLATEHLLQLGHRTVWHVAGPEDWNEARLRTEGWRLTLRDHGVVAPEPLRGDWTSRSGYEAGLRLVDETDATAVFVANDQMALGVLRAFHERGIAVPDDRSVVGFDDLPEAEFLIPGLTTVRQDFDAVGRKGLERLVTLIEGGAVRRRAVRVEPELVIRASSGRPKRPGRSHGRRGKPSASR